MAADDVVGENLELGLVVHRRGRRQQNGLALHAAIGLLRVRLDDHLALIDAGRFVGDDVPVVFAALPARGGVLDDEGRVGMALASQQAEAAERDFRAGLVVPNENLPAHEAAARDESEGVELRVGGERCDLTFEMQARVVIDQARHARTSRPRRG